MPLSERDKQVVSAVFARGSDAFQYYGMDDAAARVWLGRDDVVREIKRVAALYQDQPALLARVRFIARQEMAHLAPGAVGVLAKALAGPEYETDPNGNYLKDKDGKFVLKTPDVTSAQFSASQQILDRLGVVYEKSPAQIEISVTQILQQNVVSEVADSDPALKTEEQRGIARERVRNVLLGIMPDMDEMIKTGRDLAMPATQARKDGISVKSVKQRVRRKMKRT